MRYMEMLMALGAIMFFTTISLVYNRGMWSQAEALDGAAKSIQAVQLAHSRLDEIDAKLFSKQLAFANIGTTYTGTQVVTLPYPNYTFNVTYTPNYCDSLGNVTATANALFFRMSISINGPGLRSSVRLTRLYTKTNMNI